MMALAYAGVWRSACARPITRTLYSRPQRPLCIAREMELTALDVCVAYTRGGDNREMENSYYGFLLRNITDITGLFF